MEAGDDKKEDKKWRLNRLTDIHGRRYMLKAQAVELFFADMEGKPSIVLSLIAIFDPATLSHMFLGSVRRLYHIQWYQR